MFTKDTRTETFLTQMGVDFRYTSRVVLTDLSNRWDKENLSRPVPLREDAILEYSMLMDSGSLAPAPILHSTNDGYCILDGVQRISAAVLSGSIKLSAYIVTCDSDDLLAAIRVLSNARLQGRPEPPEWTRRRAVEILVIQRHLSVEEVARMGGWRVSDIKTIARALDWNAAILASGGPQLPDNMIDVVSQCVSKTDLETAAKPTSEFLQVIKSARFSVVDATPFIQEFFAPVGKSNKRHKILSERLAAFKSEPEVQVRICGRKSPGIPKDVNLRRTLKAVVTVLEEIEQSGDPLLYVDEFFKLLKDIDKKLHTLSKKYPKAIEVKVPADRWSN